MTPMLLSATGRALVSPWALWRRSDETTKREANDDGDGDRGETGS